LVVKEYCRGCRYHRIAGINGINGINGIAGINGINGINGIAGIIVGAGFIPALTPQGITGIAVGAVHRGRPHPAGCRFLYVPWG